MSPPSSKYSNVGTAMLFSEILAAIIAAIYYSKYKRKPIRLVLFVLWIAVVTEASASLYNKFVTPNNHWVYNLYSFLFYILLFKMVYDEIKNSLRKKIVAFLACCTMLSISFRALTTPVITRYMTTTYNIAMGVLIIALLYYAIDRLKSDAPLKPKKELELFIFGGYLLFGVCFTPLSWFIFGQLGGDYSDGFKDSLRLIQGVILLMMNGLFIIGFVWTKPDEETSKP